MSGELGVHTHTYSFLPVRPLHDHKYWICPENLYGTERQTRTFSDLIDHELPSGFFPTTPHMIPNSILGNPDRVEAKTVATQEYVGTEYPPIWTPSEQISPWVPLQPATGSVPYSVNTSSGYQRHSAAY